MSAFLTPKPIIFDCDPGDDDAVALLVALSVPERLKILGITTSSGNVSVDKTFRNARSVCSLVGREDVPVYQGNETPLMKDPLYAHHIHGEEGLGARALPLSSAPVETQHAVDFIIETLLGSSEKITLAVTGAMTNIALAMTKAPAILDKIDQIVMMGGARREKGNITPCAEFNMYVDPHAAWKVLEKFHGIVMISLDITHQVLITPIILDQYKKLQTKVSEAVVEMLQESMEAEMRVFGRLGRPIHDACVAAYLLDPQLFSGQWRYVTVETQSSLTLGQTVVGWYDIHFPHKQPNCLFLETVNAQGVLKIIHDALVYHGP